MRIALDAAGGDYGLKPNVEGALKAAAELGVEVSLVGPADAIRSELASRGVASSDRRFEIVDSPDLIAMEDDPVSACREKPKSSIMLAAEWVARQRADALVSAGHSGATMVAALWHLKRLPGVLRPAIACPLPTAKGYCVLIDGGANSECKPWHLLQFGVMGSFYARYILKIPEPSVGVLSIGEEECKGNELVREAIPLLKHSDVHFYGPVEGRDIPAGTVDVVVCDGFVGNICLKMYEGVASTLFSMLKAEASKSPIYQLGGLLMKGAARNIKKKMSYDETGGAPLLGVGGVTIICHGKSNPRAIFNAIRVAKELVESRTNEQIKASLEALKSNLELAKVES